MRRFLIAPCRSGSNVVMDMLGAMVQDHQTMVPTIERMPNSIPEGKAVTVERAAIIGPIRHLNNIRATRGKGARLFLIRNPLDSLVSWYYSMYFSHASIPIVQKAIAEGITDEAEIRRRIETKRGLQIPDIDTFVMQKSHVGHPEPREELNWPYLRDLIKEIRPEDTVLLYENLYDDQFVHDLLSFMDVSPTAHMIERVRGIRGPKNTPTTGILGRASVFEHRRDGASNQYSKALRPDTIKFITDRVPAVKQQRH